MDDIYMEDPRKYSAKQIKLKQMTTPKRRTLGQYLFDVCIKSLICAALLSINFTLFANAGNYSLFLSSVKPTLEAQYIYGAIIALSFLFMFICSLCRPLENIFLALCFSCFCIATINQFATFEKQSALLVAFSGVFSDHINNILYEQAFLIIGIGSFLIFWLLMILLKRSYKFIFLILLLAGFGWLLSQSYFNSSVRYFKTTASSPSLRQQSADENLVFLSFKGLPSTNNLLKMSEASKNNPAVEAGFKNALGFYMDNNFTLYPNAMLLNDKDTFLNILSAYNPNSKEPVTSHIQTEALREGYFDFETLQFEKKYIKDSSLYEKLRKDGYNINVYQTEDIDTCYLNNKLSVISCKEKISIPMSMSGNFSLIEKILLLTSQWLSSTGLVSDINPVLNALKYLDIDPQIAPFGFSTDKLSVVNSIAALDQIAYNIDHQNGKQAYFAIIDMPSETYVYDEYCQIKPMSEWTSEKSDYNQKTVNDRRIDYAQQVSCLYGSLGKFILQLQKMEMLDRTTIIIEGLINPLNLSKPDNDFYAQMQNKQQTALAIRKSSAPKAEIDYTVCSVGEFLNSFFFTGKNCEEFSGIKLSLSVKQQVNNGKYSENLIANAKRSYDNWFKIWKVKNQIESSYVDNISKNKDGQAPAQENILDTKLETDEPSAPEASVEFENIKISETEISETKETTPEIQEEKIEETITEEIIIPVVKETVKEQLSSQEKETTAPKATATQETKGQDVIPETLFDTKPELEKAVKKTVKKKSLISPKKPTVKTTKKNTSDVKSAVEKDIQKTTGTQKQKLSPEELKKRYHETLKEINNQDLPHHEVSIKVYEN